jgi:hypothetical protein
MSDEKPADKPPKAKLTHAERTAELLRNPRFVRAKSSAAGFIVGGFNSAPPKPKP